MTRPTVRLAAAATVALLPLGVLTSCGEDDPEPESEDPTSAAPSESDSTSPEESTEPEPPAATDGNDEAAAKAFVEYYFEVLGYAQASGDTRALKSIALSSCAACGRTAGAIELIYRRDGFIQGGEYSVRQATASKRADLPDGDVSFDAEAIVTNTAQTVRGSGKAYLDGRQPPGQIELQFRLAHTSGEWKMLEWSGKP